MDFHYFEFQGGLTSATLATSEGAQGIFSKIIFLKSVRSNEKDEVCRNFLVKIFTKFFHRGVRPILNVTMPRAKRIAQHHLSWLKNFSIVLL